MTAIIINDFVSERRIITTFDDADFARVDEAWGQQDRLLLDMQSYTTIFSGRTRWCELGPSHFRALITNNLMMLAVLDDADKKDVGNATVRSLHFLVAALIRYIETTTESTVELMHINRIRDADVTFDYTASLDLTAGETVRNTETAGLRIIVDNTGA